MLSFHITLHARPDDAVDGPEIELAGRRVKTLSVPHRSLATPMGVSFESAAQALDKLPRMFIEPDGSLVWTSPQGEPAWQVDGNLYDRQERLLFVDLKGNCPAARFDELLRTLGWPQTPVMMQLVREAVLLSEDEFRRFAAGA